MESDKTEKEKMLGGVLYNAGDPQLIQDRFIARKRLRELNSLSESDFSFIDLYESRKAILEYFLGSIGENCIIESPFYCDYGYNIFLGNRVFINFNCTILDPNEVTIGNDVQIASGVQIITATHPIDAEERISGPELAYKIIIGDKVWIGSGAIILPGITIGENTTIGAGSVVTKDVPKNVVAAGNPCKVIKKLKN